MRSACVGGICGLQYIAGSVLSRLGAWRKGRRQVVRYKVVTTLVCLWASSLLAVEAPFVVEGERMRFVKGRISVIQHPDASGGAFVEAQEEATMKFTLNVPKPMKVRVIPILWRNSLRTPPRFFPYPLPTLLGPDAVVALDNRFYFTAPASGQIGIVDASSGRVVGRIKVGGYLTDLVADEKRQRLLVADAWYGRIVAINARTRTISAQVKIPQVWALTLGSDDKIFAVSRGERRLIVLNAETLEPLCQVALPARPLQIAVRSIGDGKQGGEVAIGFEPLVLRLPDFAVLPADRFDYSFGPRIVAEFGQRNQIGWKRFSITSKGLQLIVRTEKGDERRIISMPRDAQPVALTLLGSRLLVATDKGVLIILDAVSEAITATLQIADQPFDVAVVANKAFATDPTRNRLLLIDAERGTVVRVISVPSGPTFLEGYEPQWWTRDEASQPLLFVACRKARALAVVEVATDQIARVLPLPFEPAFLRVVLPPDPSWWPLIPADRIAFELTPRLAIAPAPVVWKGGAFTEYGELPAFHRRTSAAVRMPDGTQVSVTADNNHTLRFTAQREGKIVNERWIDTSEVTDTQGVAPVVDFGAVKIADQPWHRGIWMTPDQHLFLIADTEEFWRWNAPVLSLRSGINTIPVTLKKFVQLDALRLEPVPPLELKVTGESPVNVPERYRAVFYADEPTRFRLILNLPPHTSFTYPVRLVIRIRNYMGEEVWVRVLKGVKSKGQRIQEWAIEPKLKGTGIFLLEARAETPYGATRCNFYFLKLPKMERPRLLARKAQFELARSQITRYPNLFSRYFTWLKKHLNEPHMLPVSLVRSEFTAVLPPEQQKMPERGGWRRYDFAWRLIALQFASMVLPDTERQELRQRVLQVLKSGRTDSYCHFHHHGPFFPGFVAAFLDLVASDIGENVNEVKQLREFLATRLGDMNVFAWTLAAVGDPPSERERILLWHLMTWTVNAERYFAVHAGKRGGSWWLNQRTACHCPFAAYSLAFFYLRNFYGEERFFRRTFVRGFLTHARLSRPINDARGLFGPPGPPGEPQSWLTFALSRHPLTEAIYGWRKLLRRLNSDESISDQELSEILTFPRSAANSAPVPFVLPLGLALGWYDPESPQVKWDELPETLFFDGEGEVVMRSDYGPQATEIFFSCGIRDHVYRHQPTNLMVLKAGEPLLGTASLWGDHGCPTLQISRGNSWGNVVVIEPSDWRSRWKHNLFHPRGEEQAIINRFSDATFRILVREQRLTGYVPAEGGYGGGLNLHGHTETFLHREGHIVAFETHPVFDYVAGDATLSWLPEQARLVLRQIVFVKPDLLVVYDRVRLGEKAKRIFWLAATGPELRVGGNQFVVRSGDAFLNGFVAFPKPTKLVAIDPSQSPAYQPMFDKQALELKVLEIHPSGRDGERVRGDLVEFLIAMRVGLGKVPMMIVTPTVTARQLGVVVQAGEKKAAISFDRSDVCSGNLVIFDGAQIIRYRLRERVNDTYGNWRTDPRYRRWLMESRFDFLAID